MRSTTICPSRPRADDRDPCARTGGSCAREHLPRPRRHDPRERARRSPPEGGVGAAGQGKILREGAVCSSLNRLLPHRRARTARSSRPFFRAGVDARRDCCPSHWCRYSARAPGQRRIARRARRRAGHPDRGPRGLAGLALRPRPGPAAASRRCPPAPGSGSHPARRPVVALRVPAVAARDLAGGAAAVRASR